MAYTLAKHGFAQVPGVLGERQRNELLATLINPQRAGHRGLLTNPQVRTLAVSKTLLNLVRPHLPAEPVAVRTIYFDKTPNANWFVPWHQDLTIAVAAKADVSGFGPWSVKDGLPHVQPPVEHLEQMLTVRWHFDDTGASNGALRVFPGTHKYGKLSVERIATLRNSVRDVLCNAAAGDVLLMRPLLLHASSRSTSPNHRRVLHIEYAGFPLPRGLNWSEAA